MTDNAGKYSPNRDIFSLTACAPYFNWDITKPLALLWMRNRFLKRDMRYVCRCLIYIFEPRDLSTSEMSLFSHTCRSYPQHVEREKVLKKLKRRKKKFVFEENEKYEKSKKTCSRRKVYWKGMERTYALCSLSMSILYTQRNITFVSRLLLVVLICVVCEQASI